MFSVVIPLYNKADTIVRCLKSVLRQDYKEFEVLVVDDGSTDQSKEAVNSLTDERIKVFSQINRGQAAARNRGVELSSYPYICFLDADDKWSPFHLSHLRSMIMEFPKDCFYSTSFAYVKNGKQSYYRSDFLQDGGDTLIFENYVMELIHATSSVTTNSVCVKKEEFLNIGGFNEDLPLAQDIDLWLKYYLFFRIVYSKKVTSFYHLGDSDQVTSTVFKYKAYYPFLINLSSYIVNECLELDDRNAIRKLQNIFGKELMMLSALEGDETFSRDLLINNLVQINFVEKLFMHFYRLISKSCSLKIIVVALRSKLTRLVSVVRVKFDA